RTMGAFNRTSVIIGVAGIIVGIVLGMVLFWGLFPVQWTDANTYDLSLQAKAEYVGLVADSFSVYNDRDLAAGHFDQWRQEEMEQAFADALDLYQGRPDKVQRIEDLATVLAVTPAPQGQEPGEEPAAEGGLWERIRIPCLVFFIVLLVLVLGWVGFRVAMRQRAAGPSRPAATPSAPPPSAVEEWEGTGQPPLGHFFTTYQLGEDTYDESFSIETPMGEFLGECGVGISETIGNGDPDKVTAFEVWLFDKSDIRTVTKVLMSEHAFNDNALKSRLSAKGDPVLARPGATLRLETTGLQVDVEVNELIYGEGDQAPRSFFSKLTVELVARAKTSESDSAF
ncbi:MAG: hypothetical protein ACK2UY_04985, partial [Anaerolineae bacterium]